MLFQKGEVVCNRYRIIAFIGQGAYSEVYLAEHINLKVFRAIKCISRQLDSYGTALREANVLKNLRHPAIPIIYDIEENDDCVCIVEEYVDGMSLNSFISTHKRISIRRIIQIVLQICEVVGYLHDNNIYHADIKPENILYKQGRIYLIDYGNARLTKESESLNIGTKGYAPPELYVNKRLGAAGDIYSIGVVMLVLATHSKDVEAIKRISSKEYRNIVSDCILHSEKERIKDIRELTFRLNKLSKRKVKSDNVSLSICFVGAYHHCGVTHCALMTGKFFSKQGLKSIVYEKNDSGHFHHIIHEADKVKFNNGVFNADNQLIVPQYYGCVNMEDGPYAERKIFDYGVLSETDIDKIINFDVICLVTNGKAYELSMLNELYKDSRYVKIFSHPKLFTIFNLTDIRTYKQIIRDTRFINPVRVGCFPNHKNNIRRAFIAEKKKY